MDDIYSLANRVLVWLGPETQDSSRAMQLLNTVGSQATVTAIISSASGTDDKQSNTVAEFRCNEEAMYAVERLFISLWFERLWVWLEIRLANDSALVLHGYDIILWQNMLTAVYAL